MRMFMGVLLTGQQAAFPAIPGRSIAFERVTFQSGKNRITGLLG
jgi:hypothetical protein